MPVANFKFTILEAETEEDARQRVKELRKVLRSVLNMQQHAVTDIAYMGSEPVPLRAQLPFMTPQSAYVHSIDCDCGHTYTWPHFWLAAATCPQCDAAAVDL